MGGDPAGGQLGHRVGSLDVQPLRAVGKNIFTANVQIFLPGARPGCCHPTGWSRPARSTAEDERLSLVLRRQTESSSMCSARNVNDQWNISEKASGAGPDLCADVRPLRAVRGRKPRSL